jgi:glycosyltransferase involved in cell wall biosynthesis
MRAVIVTLLRPPDPARDRHGIYRRLEMFLHGVSCVCEEIEIVHFARPEEMALVAHSSAESSAFWGTPVTVRLVPLSVKPRLWWQAASVAFSVRYRGDFRPFLGPDQASALGRILAASPSPTLIFAHRLPAMAALLQLRRVRSPIFFDLDDVEHRVKLRAAQTASSPLAKMHNLLEIPALLQAERRSIARATRTFVCSALDRAILSELNFDVSRTVVAPNAVEVAEPRPGLLRSKSVLFLGNYGYPPNAEAAERLITRIWPKLRAITDSARLIIAGDHPERIPSFAHQPRDVEFTGFVDDLETLYARARIVCCPICNGGGTRLKLIEAAGYGKPIVATPVAVEGLEFKHASDILVHDDENELALACARLLQDDALADALAAAAHRKARSLYSLANLPELIAHELRAGLAGYVIAKGTTGENGTRLGNTLSRLVRFPTIAGSKRENR